MAEQQSKILISACLFGLPVRFDGQSKKVHHPVLNRWRDEGRLVAICPEVSGGLPVPRPAAEIDGSAADALNGRALVKTADGEDVSRFFVCGAEHALVLCRQNTIRVAILKENSPSCGSARVKDGSFSGRLIPGEGITAHTLRQNGIRVFSEHDIDAAADYLSTSEAG